ncbi:STAS domain-containing protein [Streptomyces longispororuber]|uniref:STAS domain-containing protein n=1 Tax=Streptomyces longispororuber TaxID=68230 RepID=UPI001E3A6303|nr:STAS domain-containing protein [Streptomyces longispororuber]
MPWDKDALQTLTSTTSGSPVPGRAAGHSPYGPGVRQYACGEAWVVAADGEYDMGSITPLREALETAARQYRKVVLDASAVTFADSTFLNVLLQAHRTGTLRVVAPSPQVRRLCEITGVDSVLDIRRTVEEAAAS